MSATALSGNDTSSINGRVLADFGDGDCVKLTFPNDISNVKTGKNGNAIYGLNESGRQVDVEMMLVRGSADDKFMNGLLQQMLANFSGFSLLIGTFIKKLGDGTGQVTSDTYILSGGVFIRNVDVKMNVEGDTVQSLSVYRMKFANSPRAIT